jgi:hypothetical protein
MFLGIVSFLCITFFAVPTEAFVSVRYVRTPETLEIAVCPDDSSATMTVTCYGSEKRIVVATANLTGDYTECKAFTGRFGINEVVWCTEVDSRNEGSAPGRFVPPANQCVPSLVDVAVRRKCSNEWYFYVRTKFPIPQAWPDQSVELHVALENGGSDFFAPSMYMETLKPVDGASDYSFRQASIPVQWEDAGGLLNIPKEITAHKLWISATERMEGSFVEVNSFHVVPVPRPKKRCPKRLDD